MAVGGKSIVDEWEHQNGDRMIQNLMSAIKLVKDAKILADELERDVLTFEVVLTIPRSLLTPQLCFSGLEESREGNEVSIRVINHQRGIDSIWSLDTLKIKMATMRGLHRRSVEGSTGPFVIEEGIGSSFEQPILLGVANIYLECLYYGISRVHDAPIISPSGMVSGKLKLGLLLIEDNRLEEPVKELKLDTNVSIQVSIIEAYDLPTEYSNNLFCQYKFWGREETCNVPFSLTSDGVYQFEHKQVFNVKVTQAFLDHIRRVDAVLAVEVWGQSNYYSSKPANKDSYSLLSERWRQFITRLELWVDILELNDQGEYVPVEVQDKHNVNTGGVYQIRQGQSRRIRVSVAPCSGNGPLVCDSISSISVGSIELRNKSVESLDSYQTVDLTRLHLKWNEPLNKKHEFLECQVKKFFKETPLSQVTSHKERQLYEQCQAIQKERLAAVQLTARSVFPGAADRPGMEKKVSVIFLDLKSHDHGTSLGATAELLGERADSMVPLEIKEAQEAKAIALWGCTVHDNNIINKVSGKNDRVYAIIRVCVKLKNPPGFEIILRKRICLKVRNMTAHGPIKNVFCNTSGVMFEVVTGLPNSEEEISANPFVIEFGGDGNILDKFKGAITSVANELALDQYEQEISLKQKLIMSGELLKFVNNRKFSATEKPLSSRKLTRSQSATFKRTASKSASKNRYSMPSCPEDLQSASAKFPQSKTFHIGDKVKVKLTKKVKSTKNEDLIELGTVKFIGETKFASGEWIGVALDKPYGKNNGSLDGETYFKCRDNHGVFVKKDKVTHVPASFTANPAKHQNGSFLQEAFERAVIEKDELQTSYDSLMTRFKEMECQIQNSLLLETRIQELEKGLNYKADEVSNLQNQLMKIESSWKVKHEEITLSEKELGRGGWGVIWIGEFRGQKVAVKQIHEIIVSEHTIELLDREITIMAQLRHPNLLQFIGAVFDHPSGNPMIITEVMDTSLRKAYEKKVLTPDQQPVILSIMRDVAVGLNYLHCLPEPIIHRDVSSANVLLESKGPGKWKTKISDFGSAKNAKSAVTEAPGAQVYSAPECHGSIVDDTKKQTPKVDVFSYGILLCEVTTCHFPSNKEALEAMLRQVRTTSRPLHSLITSCIEKNPTKRPSMNDIIKTKLSSASTIKLS